VSEPTVIEDQRDSVLAREAEFHDALAAELNPAGLPPRAPDELEDALFEIAGDLRGQRVLDLGCGQGDLTLMLLQRGAEVTALDVSAGMVELAERRVQVFAPDAKATFLAGDAQATGLPAGSFDLVLGKWIIHHLDVEAITTEMERLLRPGGAALFIENQGTNPLLRFARAHLAGRFGIPMYGTPDEHPLVQEDFELFERHFPTVKLLYPDFFFFRLFDRQIFRKKSARLSQLAWDADLWVERRIPRLRRYSHHLILGLYA
jgi:SAM-dependent methyltransferase